MSGGGPANCGLGLSAFAGTFPPQATVSGAGACGVTVPVWVPGAADAEGLAASV